MSTPSAAHLTVPIRRIDKWDGSELRSESVTMRFGGLVAVDDVSLTVEPGRITALIGPNGAGKTTLFNCLTGITTPVRGRVLLDGRDVTRLSPAKRSALGVARTFQRLEIFTGMTVFENLQVAFETREPRRNWRSLLTLGSGDEPGVVALVNLVIERLGLADVAQTRAADLPTGLLRMVELGRALATIPRVLILDEPASGQDPAETEQLQGILVELAREGLSILLVEHDVDLVMHVSDQIYVMEFGQLIATGDPAHIQADPRVRRAYLGTAEEVPDADVAGM